jgi:hypothetical protein
MEGWEQMGAYTRLNTSLPNNKLQLTCTAYVYCAATTALMDNFLKYLSKL